MGKNSKIEWTDHTWNPWIGCTKVSAGCKNCYMFRDRKRYGQNPELVTRTKPKTFKMPLHIEEPSKFFVCSWSDFFHESIDPLTQKDAMEIMYQSPMHTFMLLTKRPENIFIRPDWWRTCPNVWLGVSVEDVHSLWRIDAIEDIPASIKFVSAEPLLDLVDFEPYIMNIDWIIVGGESGPGHRQFDPEWARAIRDMCAFYQVPFFMKQMSGNTKKEREAIPEDLQIREFPNVQTL